MTFDLSSDSTKVVFSKRTEHASLWILDLSRGVTSPLTSAPSSSYSSPRWGPQNHWVVAHRSDPPPLTVVKILPDGRESVVGGAGAQACIVDDVSKNGQYLLCRPPGANLLALPLTGGKPVLVRNPPTGSIDQAQFSPDGRWIAYNADESGRYEIYLTAFPPTGERWKVSQGGGVQPVWRHDGRELYYLGFDGVLKAVELRGTDFPQLSVPNRLFDTRLAAPSPWVEQYTVSADGRRFLILRPVDDKVRNSIGVILNWPELLQAGRIGR
jgi:Tol biopolymer transport system component